jgi:hypothetical protein
MEFQDEKTGFLLRQLIKSMAALRLDAATLGWHGVEGERRLAFRQSLPRPSIDRTAEKRH